MNDLVECLRERTENIDCIFEAAEEIERLECELAKARDALRPAREVMTMIESAKARLGGRDMGIVHSGEKNPNWRGGRSIASNGYVLIRVGADHHLADVRGYAYEHRLVAEKKLGRRLRPNEEIHHINGDKKDNRPENIEVAASRKHHAVFHRAGGKTKQFPEKSITPFPARADAGPHS